MPTLTDDAIRAHIDSLLRPPDSLGRLAAPMQRLCYVQGTLAPTVKPRRLVVFAADHGVVKEVSRWSSEDTTLTITRLLDGGAIANALARCSDTALRVVDVGTIGGRVGCDSDHYRCAQVAPGTANLALVPAMSQRQCEAALAIGREEAEAAIEAGDKIVAAGAVGGGGRVAAACVAALGLSVPPWAVIGRSVESDGALQTRVAGIGVDDDDATLARERAALAHQRAVLDAAVKRARPVHQHDAWRGFASVAGFELMAMAGFYSAALAAGCAVMLDDFTSAAAALLATLLVPSRCKAYIASHVSADVGHALLLKRMSLRPLLDGSMQLGQGAGALLAMPLLDAAAAISAAAVSAAAGRA